MTTYLEHATIAARELNLLAPDGHLVGLDSLTTIDYLIELENRTSLEIPTARLTPAVLASVGAVAEMLAALASELAAR